MKKLTAFVSAAMIVASAVPCTTCAAEEMVIKNFPHTTATDWYEYEEDILQDISEKGIDIDFNSDGKFDNLDCYLLCRYDPYNPELDAIPEDIKAKIIKNADLDGDGEISETEETKVIYHFLLNCGIDLSIFDTATYKAYDDVLEIPHGPSYNSNYFSVNYVFSLNCCAVNLHLYYPFLQKAIEEGRVDPDVNNDGKFDIEDVLASHIATTYAPWITIRDPDTGYYTSIAAYNNTITLDKELEERAWKLSMIFDVYDNYSFIQYYDSSALLDCLFQTEPVSSEYLDNTYYEKFHKDAQYYYLGDMVQSYLDYMKLSEDPKSSLKEIADKIHEVKKHDLEYEALEKQYFEDIETGKLLPPDLNFDNFIDGRDVYITQLYHGDRVFDRNAEESKLTKEEYDNISTNCDLNKNGVSGDDDDINMIFNYVSKTVSEWADKKATDPNGEYYKNYADDLYMKGMSQNITDHFYLNDASKEYEFLTLEQQLEDYTARVAMRLMTTPDIDGNGVTDELDKKYADSYVNFLETGTMGDTEIPDDVIERIKTECDFTYDGNSGLLYDMKVASMYISKYILHDDKTTPEKLEADSGDLNDDGKIDASDATLVLVNYSLLSTGEKMQLTENQQKAADVNGDGKIDASDATMILQYYSYLSTGGDLVFKEFMKQNG
ncbi:MAG: hypothetical protein IKH75_20025 [Ruminococcus sp.]|nr:hypothetical protein [Ruminococcus sp.]